MKIKKTLRKKRLITELEENEIMYLIMGWCLGPCPFQDEEHTKNAWLANKDYIMSLRGSKNEHIGLTFENGKRPWAWWQYEAPEPRRIVSVAPGQDFDKVCDYVKSSGKGSFGRYKWSSFEIYESQYQYLKRLGLSFIDEDSMFEDREDIETPEK